MTVTKKSPLLVLAFIFLLSTPCLALDKGEKLLPFAGETLQGQTIDLGDIIGKKPVMLVFWASWCPNCVREIPLIDQLLTSPAAKDLQVIAVNVGHNDSEARARKFMEETKMTYPVIFDRKSKITRQYKIFSVPTVFISNTEGKVVFRQHFIPDAEKLQTLLH